MTGRISSKVVYQLIALVTAATSITSLTAEATAQTGFFTDPQTGIVYRKISRTIEKPVVETKLSQQSEVVYRPHTITETKPENRTVMTPIVEYKWKPKLTGRWNPFRPPSIRYEKVPHTTWEARTEVVHRTKTTTQWIAENRTLEIPTKTVRTSREHSVAYEAGGASKPPTTYPPMWRRGSNLSIATLRFRTLNHLAWQSQLSHHLESRPALFRQSTQDFTGEPASKVGWQLKS